MPLRLIYHISNYDCLLCSLVNRQKQWKKDEVDRIANLPDPDLPDGHRKMANEERKETLRKLQESKCHPARQSDQSPMTLLYILTFSPLYRPVPPALDSPFYRPLPPALDSHSQRPQTASTTTAIANRHHTIPFESVIYT